MTTSITHSFVSQPDDQCPDLDITEILYGYHTCINSSDEDFYTNATTYYPERDRHISQAVGVTYHGHDVGHIYIDDIDNLDLLHLKTGFACKNATLEDSIRQIWDNCLLMYKQPNDALFFTTRLPKGFKLSVSARLSIRGFFGGVDIAVPIQPLFSQSVFSKLQNHNLNHLNLLLKYLLAGAIPSAKNGNGFFLNKIANLKVETIDLRPVYFIDKHTLKFHVPVVLDEPFHTTFTERLDLIVRAVDFLSSNADALNPATDTISNLLSLSFTNFKQGFRKDAVKSLMKDCESDIISLKNAISYLYSQYSGPKQATIFTGPF